MDYIKPLPKINSDNEAFWEGCKKRQLKFRKCGVCKHLRWTAAIICPKCLSQKAEWITTKGRGTVYTYAVYHVAYHPGFADELPYVTAIVELDEGPHLLTNIVDCSPDAVTCGMKVTVAWDEVVGGIVLPKFKPL